MATQTHQAKALEELQAIEQAQVSQAMVLEEAEQVLEAAHDELATAKRLRGQKASAHTRTNGDNGNGSAKYEARVAHNKAAARLTFAESDVRAAEAKVAEAEAEIARLGVAHRTWTIRHKQAVAASVRAFSNGRGGSRARAKKGASISSRKAEKAERDRMLRAVMRGKGSGGKPAIGSNPKKAAKRARKARQKK